MKPKWLLQGKDIFKENIFEIENTIKTQGMEFKIANYIPFQPKQELDFFDPNDCVIFYGTLSLAQAVRRQCSWIPGVWCDLSKLECINYYNYLGKYLINKNLSIRKRSNC